jgi:hypothetical protein
MTNKNNYSYGSDAVKRMEDILSGLWVEETLGPTHGESIEYLNKVYQSSRDAAMAFGENVSQYPRRLKWSTKGLDIVERVKI